MLVVLEVLEVTVVTLHAAKTMVALAVIVNVTSGGGRVYGGCTAHAAEWDYNRGRKRLQPPFHPLVHHHPAHLPVKFDMSWISS